MQEKAYRGGPLLSSARPLVVACSRLRFEEPMRVAAAPEAGMTFLEDQGVAERRT